MKRNIIVGWAAAALMVSSSARAGDLNVEGDLNVTSNLTARTAKD